MKIKIENVLIIGGLALWIIENAYFVWNLEARNNVGRLLDWFTTIIIWTGLVISWSRWLNRPKITNINIKLDENLNEK